LLITLPEDFLQTPLPSRPVVVVPIADENVVFEPRDESCIARFQFEGTISLGSMLAWLLAKHEFISMGMENTMFVK